MIFKIYENDTLINRIVADEAFVADFCEANGYTYEKEETTSAEPAAPVESISAADMAAAIQEGVNEV